MQPAAALKTPVRIPKRGIRGGDAAPVGRRCRWPGALLQVWGGPRGLEGGPDRGPGGVNPPCRWLKNPQRRRPCSRPKSETVEKWVQKLWGVQKGGGGILNPGGNWFYRPYTPAFSYALVTPPPPRAPSQMGLDRGPPLPGTATPWGRCYVDGAALPLRDQVEEIGVASHGLQESPASEQRGGGHIRALFGVPLSTSGQEPGVSAPPRATMYVWDSPSGLSMVLTVTRGLVDLWVNPPGCPKWPGACGCTPEENVACGSPS